MPDAYREDALERAAKALAGWHDDTDQYDHPRWHAYLSEAQAALTAAHLPELLAVVKAAQEMRAFYEAALPTEGDMTLKEIMHYPGWLRLVATLAAVTEGET
jgi:hypothetical protein